MDAPVAIRTTIAGPWGPVHVAATDRGIVAVEWLISEADFDAALARRLAGPVRSARPERPVDDRAPSPGQRHLAAGVAWIEAFLGGQPAAGRVPMDLADRPAWDRHVLGAVAAIPWGETASYGDVARRVGAPRAARAVGGALGRNPISFLIPCHRVIAADGTLGGWGGDRWGDVTHRLEMKRGLLLREGVSVAPRDG